MRLKYTTLTFSPSFGTYSVKAKPFDGIPTTPPKPEDLQTCTCCGKEKTLDKFAKDLLGKNGRTCKCITCRNKHSAKVNTKRRKKRFKYPLQ